MGIKGVSKDKKKPLASPDLTVDQKFARVMFKLKQIRPFYSAVYESIPHVETKSIDTMAVSSTQLLYNYEFVDKISFEEFFFVVLHEIGHISLMHVPRMIHKNSKLWNIAADLYVNKMLAEEFSIEPNEIDDTNNIKFLEGGLYCSSIDLNNDYVEDLYEKLIEQGEKNGYLKYMSSNTNITESRKFTFEIEGRAKTWGKYSKLKIDIDVLNLTGGFGDGGDLVLSGADEQEEINENRRILAEAKTRHDMYGSGVGSSPCQLERMVGEILKSHIDWRKLLRKYCIMATRKDTSFAMPDKRMYYQSAIYPGQALESENTGLKGVKICFDTSGSISEKDLGYFYGQVKDLLKEFKVEAEVLCWDTEIESRFNIGIETSINTYNTKGGGGTNPDCLFIYFDSKVCKIKPIVTLIFTDGYIGGNQDNSKWKKKYKNTIWVMTRNYNKNFKPSFGTITVAKYEGKDRG